MTKALSHRSPTPRSHLDRFSAALAPEENGAAESAARELATHLHELGGTPAHLGETVTSYNRFIEASSVQFLENPPAELLALQSALGTMVEAAIRAAEECGALAAEQD